MIFAGRRRRATEPQIRLILELTSQSDIRDVKTLKTVLQWNAIGTT